MKFTVDNNFLVKIQWFGFFSPFFLKTFILFLSFPSSFTFFFLINFLLKDFNNLRYADDTTIMAKSEEELKSLLMKVKGESKKVVLKINIQKTKIMASGHITSWQIDGETVETVTDFIFLGSKITADGDCGHEIKRRLFLGRKVMTNLDSIEKQRHYFVNKGPSSQGYGFSSSHVWM